MERTPPPLIAPLGVFSYGFGFLEVGFISDMGNEFVDWFFEDHVDPLPNPTLVVNRAFLLLLVRTLTHGNNPCSFLHLLNVVLQPGEHLDPGHEVPEVSWTVERQVFPEPLPRSRPEFVTHHCQLLGALLDLVVYLPVSFVVVPDCLVLALSECQQVTYAF